MYKKGQSGNPNGRPRGAKDHTWMKVSTWIIEIRRVWPELTANQKAHYSTELVKLLTSKLKTLPTDPTDSKSNVSSSLQLLNEIEGSAKPPIAIPQKDRGEEV